MGMGGGSTGGAVSEINVTPLIDVLLVLLIIFMVIVPVTPKGWRRWFPSRRRIKTETQPNDRTIVVQVLSNGAGAPSYKINDNAFDKQDIEPKLTEIFADPSGEGDVREGRQGPGLQQGRRGDRLWSPGRSRQHRSDHAAG